MPLEQQQAESVVVEQALTQVPEYQELLILAVAVAPVVETELLAQAAPVVQE
jgi:hypothetical protein